MAGRPRKTELQRQWEEKNAKDASRPVIHWGPYSKLTLEQAISRKEWQDNWEDYCKYAGKVAWTYCAKRLKQYSLDQIREVRDEALSEAWRFVCNGDQAEHAITKAANNITYALQRHQEQSQELPELPEHRPEYYESEDDLRELIAALPEKLRALAIVLSAEPDLSNYDLAELLQCSEPTIRRYRKQLAERLGSRFGYHLLAEMEISPARRIA